MGQERSEVKVESQKKNKLKIGVRGKQQVLLQGQPRSLAETYFFNVHHVVLVYCRRKFDKLYFLLFLTTQIGWLKGEIIRI